MAHRTKSSSSRLDALLDQALELASARDYGVDFCMLSELIKSLSESEHFPDEPAFLKTYRFEFDNAKGFVDNLS